MYACAYCKTMGDQLNSTAPGALDDKEMAVCCDTQGVILHSHSGVRNTARAEVHKDMHRACTGFTTLSKHDISDLQNCRMIAKGRQRRLTAWRSAICSRTCFSMAEGSRTASVPSTRIRLLSFTLGLGGSSRPCRISSCFSFSRSMRFCVLIFFRSCTHIQPRQQSIIVINVSFLGCVLFCISIVLRY